MELAFQITFGKMITNTIVLDAKTLNKPTTLQIAIRSFFRLPVINIVDAFSFLIMVNLHDRLSKTEIYKNNNEDIEKAKKLIEINKKYSNSI